MKLVRFGERGHEKPGMIDANGSIRDLSMQIEDFTADVLSPDGISRLQGLNPANLPLAPTGSRLGSAIATPGKFLCIGLNYRDHAAETGSKLPDYPMLFMKASSALNGPNDPIIMPRDSTHTDWEVELGAVIGRPAKYVSEADALNYVAGYCTVNDVSERHFQKNLSGQFTKGKSCDTYGPVGPWLVTSDEVPDPQDIALWCAVNGKRYQDGNTSNMIFTVAQIIAHLSSMMTLYPGDIISTGTPAGVGLGMKPEPVFLKTGDVVETCVEGLGTQKAVIEQDA